MKHRIVADNDSNSDSSDPASHTKGQSKKSKSNLLLVGAGAGNYRPMILTRNKSIKRVKFTQCGFTNGPRVQSNKTIHCDVCSKDISYRNVKVEGGRFDDDNNVDT